MFKGTPNANGRPKGSPNKATTEVRKAFTQLVENNLEQMQKDLDDLEARDRIKLLIDLAGFVIPKMKSIEMTADINQTNNEDLINRLLQIPEENFNKLYEND